MSVNKFKVLDLFAGAGGFGLGFLLASERFKLICSLEIDKWAVETLHANNASNQKIIHGDIRKFNTAEAIQKVSGDQPDIIIGGPPCQGFSVAGPVKDPKDPRNSLFKNYLQWVKILQPKIFVLENVKGLLLGKNEKGIRVIDIIKNKFEKIGYSLTVWELNAAHFGVPQNRERIFIVGSKFKCSILPPRKTHYLPDEYINLNGKAKSLSHAITVINAIGDLPPLKAGEGKEVSKFSNKPLNEFQNQLRGDNILLYNHVTMSHTPRTVKRYEQILNGLSLSQISDELKVRKRNGNGVLSKSEYNSNYRHLKPDMISYTIPASFYSQFIHPNQPRNITSREAARLQSFPDSYIFKGKRTQMSSNLLKKLGRNEENHLSQYNQIGNAVPPLLAKAVASRILEFMNEEAEYAR